MLSRRVLTSTKFIASTSLLACTAAYLYSIPTAAATLGSAASKRNMSDDTGHKYPVSMSDDEWRVKLNKEQFRVSLVVDASERVGTLRSSGASRRGV